MTGAELRVWIRIRGRKLDGWKFRRQHPIGPYVVDFYCPGAKLVVEVNGPAHDGDARWAYDARRQAWLEAEGYRMLRIPVHRIDEDADEVAGWILAVLDEQEAAGFRRRPLRPASPATSPLRGEDLVHEPLRPASPATSPLRGEDLVHEPLRPASPATSP